MQVITFRETGWYSLSLSSDPSWQFWEARSHHPQSLQAFFEMKTKRKGVWIGNSLDYLHMQVTDLSPLPLPRNIIVRPLFLLFRVRAGIVRGLVHTALRALVHYVLLVRVTYQVVPLVENFQRLKVPLQNGTRR
jgi:hypothetical protein